MAAGAAALAAAFARCGVNSSLRQDEAAGEAWGKRYWVHQDPLRVRQVLFWVELSLLRHLGEMKIFPCRTKRMISSIGRLAPGSNFVPPSAGPVD